MTAAQNRIAHPLGTPRDLTYVLEQLGCESRPSPYLDAGSLACVVAQTNCGCSMYVQADASMDVVSRIRIDLFGCRTEMDDNIARILAPVVDREYVSAVRAFLSQPLRNEADRADGQALQQQAQFGSLAIRVRFGAEETASIGKERKTIWVDATVTQARTDVVADTPQRSTCNEPSTAIAQDPKKRMARRVFATDLLLWVKSWQGMVSELQSVAAFDHLPEASVGDVTSMLLEAFPAINLTRGDVLVVPQAVVLTADLTPGRSAQQLAVEAAWEWYREIMRRLPALDEEQFLQLRAILQPVLEWDRDKERGAFVHRLVERLAEIRHHY